MTLPSAGALRSGRNTSRWASSPIAAAISKPRTTASHSLVPPSWIVMCTGRLSPSVGRMSTQGRASRPLVQQLVVHEGGVHGERAVGEVDDARALVGSDDAGAEHGVHATAAEPQQRREEQFLHRRLRLPASPTYSDAQNGLVVWAEIRPHDLPLRSSAPRIRLLDGQHQLRDVDHPVRDGFVDGERAAVPRGVRGGVGAHRLVLGRVVGARDRAGTRRRGSCRRR